MSGLDPGEPAAGHERADAIRFVWRGAVQRVRNVPATMTLLDWVRLEGRAVGTKEGCAEGDCGACLVALVELDDAAPGGVSVRAINSCIQLLAMVDGKAILTVEDLAVPGGALHPVQQAMVDCHASQCGFCTPGFVMALFAEYECRDSAPDRAQICQALAGNLCRCTGYRPILEAAGRAWELPRQPLARAALRTLLELLDGRPALDYRAPDDAGGGRIQAPDTLTGLANALQGAPGARILAGATDIGLWITKQGRELPHLIHLDRVPELHRLGVEGGDLVIGAAVTHTVAWPSLLQHFPALHELARRFAAPPVCNSGTLAGNVANGSPIGDSMPALLVLDARLRLQCGDQLREVPLAEFYTGYQRNVLQAGEFLREIRVPLAAASARLACYKVSKRHDQDISALCAAFRVDLVEGMLREPRIAFGGMAATPARARACEAALAGQPLDATTLASAQAALARDFTPLSDVRATAAYRAVVAARLLERWWRELHGDPAPLRVDAVEADA